MCANKHTQRENSPDKLWRRKRRDFALKLAVAALLFSATFRKKVERLARDILTDPIRVVQGDIGEVSRAWGWAMLKRRVECGAW